MTRLEDAEVVARMDRALADLREAENMLRSQAPLGFYEINYQYGWLLSVIDNRRAELNDKRNEALASTERKRLEKEQASPRTAVGVLFIDGHAKP